MDEAHVTDADTPERPERLVVLDRLLAAHRTWFDVERDCTVGGRVFPGFAAYHAAGERYVLSRRAKLWEVANHEYLFFETRERLDEEGLAELVSFMESAEGGLSVVRPGPNHMSSNVALVVVADEVAPGVGRAVRRTRFRKNYRLGVWGWTDLRLAVVDLAYATRPRAGARLPGLPGGRRAKAADLRGRVVANGAGKRLVGTIEANLSPLA